MSSRAYLITLSTCCATWFLMGMAVRDFLN